MSDAVIILLVVAAAFGALLTAPVSRSERQRQYELYVTTKVCRAEADVGWRTIESCGGFMPTIPPSTGGT